MAGHGVPSTFEVYPMPRAQRDLKRKTDGGASKDQRPLSCPRSACCPHMRSSPVRMNHSCVARLSVHTSTPTGIYCSLPPKTACTETVTYLHAHVTQGHSVPEIAGRRPFYLKAEQKRTGHTFFSTCLLLCEERSHVAVKHVNTFL